MKSKLPRGLGLTAFTFVWLGLTAWVLLAVPRDSLGRTARGSQAAQEPAPSRTFWDLLGDRASALLHRHEGDAPREEIRQAAARMGVADYHKAGHRGKGVKIAILDSGFKGYRDALGKVLPADVTVKSFRKDGRLEARDSQHGILCAEVIHHLAPDAELLFANWEPEQPEHFLEAVRWARKQGAQIISCSIIMPTWSDGEGRGPTHQQLSQLLGDGSKNTHGTFFASAGNTAMRHYGGSFTPGKDGWHQWASGRKDNTIRPMAGDRVSVELTGPGEACYEMVVRDVTDDREVERVQTTSSGGVFTAAVRFAPGQDHRYLVRLRQVRAGANKDAGRFHLTVLGGKLAHSSKAGSIPFPGDGREVVAVSAIDAKGRRQSYSSCGPNGPGPKPDLCAVVPFASVWRPEQGFSGTSAAAPQAAALAALVWSRDPALSAGEVRQALLKAAAPTPTTKGHCCETGHGAIALPAVKR